MSQLGKCVRATARQAAGRVAPGSASLGLESDFTERHILASCSREKSAFCNHRITESRMPSSSPPLGRVMRARDTGGAVLLARESQRFAQRSGHTCGTLSHLARRRRFHGDTPLGRGRRGRGHRCAWGVREHGLPDGRGPGDASRPAHLGYRGQSRCQHAGKWPVPVAAPRDNGEWQTTREDCTTRWHRVAQF